MSIIKGAQNLENAKKWYDWALTPEAQALGAGRSRYQVPSNKNAPVPPQAPKLAEIKLINYDFAKYGSSAERKRLLSKWDDGGQDAAEVSAGVVGAGGDARLAAGVAVWRAAAGAGGRLRCPGTAAVASGRVAGCRGYRGRRERAPALAPGLRRVGRGCRSAGAGAAVAAGSLARFAWRSSVDSRCTAAALGCRGWLGAARPGSRRSSARRGRAAGIGLGAAARARLPHAALPRARARGSCSGDAFVVGVDRRRRRRLVALFVFYPVGTCCSSAVLRRRRARFAPGRVPREAAATARSGASTASPAARRCGVAWNTLFLAIAGRRAGTTLLGLAFALLAQRGRRSALKRAAAALLSVLPIITPPFVIGARADPAVRPRRRWSPCCSTTGSASRARAGSTACRASRSPSCWPSRRSPSWC